MLNLQFHAELYTGDDTTAYLESLQNRRIFMVCDSFLAENGMMAPMIQTLEKQNTIKLFTEVHPDPSNLVVQNGLVSMLDFKPDVVIGFGGGSAIDTSKALLYFAETRNLMATPLLIAVPTTSGAGSEATSVTVVTDADAHIKHLFQGDMMLPKIVLLDASLTMSVPRDVTAHTGMDVLTHALEAYVATGHNSFSDALAEKAVELVLTSLIPCYHDGTIREHRENMQEASTLAGMAFNIAGLGANHAVAHKLGGVFRVPHGLANSLMLVAVIEANSRNKSVFKRYAKFTRQLLLVDANASDELAVGVLKAVIRAMMTEMNIPKTIGECGVSDEDFFANLDKVAQQATTDFVMSTNVEPMTKEDFKAMLLAVH